MAIRVGYSMNSGKLHWLLQRISAIILIPLTLWFILKFITISSYNYNEVLSFFSLPYNSLLFLIMIIVIIYHGKLGMQTIVEDYVNSLKNRSIIIFFISFLSYILMLATLVSILIIQFSL